MRDRRCENCDNFFEIPTYVTGECRAHPPVLLVFEGDVHSYWPNVTDNNYCGEFNVRMPVTESKEKPNA